MNVLVINCGSSTLKFQAIETDGQSEGTSLERRLVHGIVEGIGSRGIIKFTYEGKEYFRDADVTVNHGEATRQVFDLLKSCGFLEAHVLDAIGHRVVHGGDRFVEPTIVDEEVMRAIEVLTDVAPLHNGPSLAAMRTAGSILGDSVPMVVVFDTAFHHTMPERASRYAIPRELAEKHRLRRYGFHGIAHRYMAERYAVITAKPTDGVKLVALQLGNGCSATAINSGRSVDTSMGFTPLEGLMMGTRSGDVDPSLAGFLARHEGVDIGEVEHWLNMRSGLLGVSGISRDMRELLEVEQKGEQHAALAVEMFCYRVRKYIGAYLGVLGGADAILFGGGIGENAPTVRARICEEMSWCGLILDQERNAKAVGLEGRISADSATIQAYVILVDEAVIIARDTVSCLRRQRPG